jgi:Ca2+-transporting ATPase
MIFHWRPQMSARGGPQQSAAPAASIDRALAGTPHSRGIEEVLEEFATTPHGLTAQEAASRLQRYGRNALPRAAPPTLVATFIRQFASPLIYVLLVAAALSMLLEEWTDAGFIMAVLLVNAIIGTAQEYGAQRSARALEKLVTSHARVEREGEVFEIDAEELVPGDVVLLDSGTKVPADLRLVETHRLTVDESLLTGESDAVNKHADAIVPESSATGDRVNMAFAGTLVASGRGHGIVVATAGLTELGRIAAAVIGHDVGRPPLLTRMERFTYRIALAVGVAALVLAVVSLLRGMPLAEIFILAVALAVSAIPEGLPVALTVALAVGLQRMARRSVIVRRLVAVEALGSCTCIASDKTGTLTVNQLTVRRIALADQPAWEVTGEGLVPEGTFIVPEGASRTSGDAQLERLCRAAALANEGALARRDDHWVGHGDTVDVALLVLAHKAGITRPALEPVAPELASIPYEPQARFAAAVNRIDGCPVVSVKGALETLLPMCAQMLTGAGPVPIERARLIDQAQSLARAGYRVLAIADGVLTAEPDDTFGASELSGLTCLGLIGMTDPLRPEVKAAIDDCVESGIEVRMVTGDHPETALAIARDLGLAEDREQVVTGADLRGASERGEAALDALCSQAKVFARVEPHQKLEIVAALQRLGHFVAVTGDGVNDAPALRAAQVGVAMGASGTDVARETAELIITDDNFASVVAGVEEGRIAYGNVRKVIFLLVSTGAAEIVLFILAVAVGTPLPLTAVQLLWLNLVTNGIQDVALAFEPAEGGELHRPPRPPGEPIFNRVMIERVLITAVLVGGLAFLVFLQLLDAGQTVEQARNGVLLLMVLFENVQAFNSRSESLSLLKHNLLRNKLLLVGTIIAQGVHIAAMYTPGLSTVLGVEPVSVGEWAELLAMALTLLLAMELHKIVVRRRDVDAYSSRRRGRHEPIGNA